MAATNKLLAIVTSADEYKKLGYRTGLWLGELTHFTDVAEEAGFTVDVASPRGGKAPLDPESLAHGVLSEGGTQERYQDRDYMNRLDRTMTLAEVDPAKYDAIFLAGGHGAMFDFPDSTDLQQLVADFWEAGKVVSAVCHGPAGLLNVKVAGTPLLAGKKVTGFSWNEEAKVQRQDAVPYNLEDELQNRGAEYSQAWFAFGSHLVEDGRLITGQNPASARGVGEAVVKKPREG
ncbi:type 1 glutamine amidotransferase domain-containing protein [Planctomyces sp. SH-PL62]|uniref:type 1 glutamine amidotransferase domain-containing protein n=1 Tax=Planctomyces sp. SH-PL62 TaxID=1636152 RepID=UPI00078B3659|nr:type 1 glutamine amidotransferase domain-containing protein [Planctomyces sp. SH-PL62]AMV36506.1 Molecular chaperone Hsp31 and glyoxalase 3 [Planctomyces sp. SH-PL62]